MKNILIVALLLVFGGLFAESMFDMTMHELSKDYIDVQKLLAADKTEGVNDLAGNMLSKIDKLDAKKAKGEHAAKYADMPKQLMKSAMSLKKAKNIKAMRSAFGDMSKPMAMWTSLNKPADTYVVYCPMAKKSWLQDSDEVANPYYGSEMPECGEIVSSPDKTKMMDHKMEKGHMMGKEMDKKAHKMSNKMKHADMEDHKCDGNCKHDEMKDKAHKMSKDMKHDMKDASHKCDGNCKHDEMKEKAHKMSKDMKHAEMGDHKCDANCKHDEKMMKKMKIEKHVCDENCKHEDMMKEHTEDANESVDKKMDKLKGKI